MVNFKSSELELRRISSNGIESLISDLSSVIVLGFAVIRFHLEFSHIKDIWILTSKTELYVQPSDDTNYIKF